MPSSPKEYIIFFSFFFLLLSFHMQYIGSAHNYSTTIAAKAAIAILGREIEHSMIPQSLAPLVFTFSGSGNVSQVRVVGLGMGHVPNEGVGVSQMRLGMGHVPDEGLGVFTCSNPSLQGAQEIFSQLPHEFVSPDSLKDVVERGGALAGVSSALPHSSLSSLLFPLRPSLLFILPGLLFTLSSLSPL